MDAGLAEYRQSEVRVIEEVKELAISPELQSLHRGEPVREVEIAPSETGQRRILPTNVTRMQGYASNLGINCQQSWHTVRMLV